MSCAGSVKCFLLLLSQLLAISVLLSNVFISVSIVKLQLHYQLIMSRIVIFMIVSLSIGVHEQATPLLV